MNTTELRIVRDREKYGPTPMIEFATIADDGTRSVVWLVPPEHAIRLAHSIRELAELAMKRPDDPYDD